MDFKRTPARLDFRARFTKSSAFRSSRSSVPPQCYDRLTYCADHGEEEDREDTVTILAARNVACSNEME
jgi:hypothetical protein